jgi:DNA-binding beta-propeller fold protein YncE
MYWSCMDGRRTLEVDQTAASRPKATAGATPGGTTMRTHARVIPAFLASLVVIIGTGLTASLAGAGRPDRLATPDGTVWVANRGAHTIQGFDTATGDIVRTVAMSPASQPGDLAYAKGKLYVAEEFRVPPAIAIVDLGTGDIGRIELPLGSRPHHVHRTRSGRLVSFGLYGTDTVAVVDTRTDSSDLGTPTRPQAPRAVGRTPRSSRQTGRSSTSRATRPTRSSLWIRTRGRCSGGWRCPARTSSS